MRIYGFLLIVIGFVGVGWGLQFTSGLNESALPTLLAPIGFLAILAGILLIFIPGFFEAHHGF